MEQSPVAPAEGVEGPKIWHPQGMLRLLESAVRQSKESILITDAELDEPGPHIIYTNPAFTVMTGYSAHEVIGKTPRILQGPLTQRSVLRRLRTCLEQGQDFEGETVNYKKDGTEFNIEWQVAPIRNPLGRVTHYIAIQRDVTQKKQLEDASLRLAAIIEFSDDAIIGKDLNSVVTSWNTGAERLFGYTAEEMIGTSILRLIPGDRQQEEDLIMTQIKAGNTVNNFDTVRRRKDGSLIDVSVTASPIKDAQGKIVGVSKSARDITWRRREVEARKATEAKYRILFEHAPAGILIADTESRYVDANLRVCEMLGYARDELIGLHASDIVAVDERANIAPALEAIQARSAYNREWRFRKKDGSIFWVHVMATSMPDGKIMGVIQDISERKNAENKIAEQAAFMDKARDAIIVRDLTGIITYWNKGAEHIYGWTPQEAVGRDIGDLLFKQKSQFSEYNATTIIKGEWQGELEHITKDLFERSIDARWTLIRDEEGKPKAVLAINSDITERKKLETQFMRAQRMESIGTLAGGIAHDLNNILAPIMMSIEMLKDVATNPETEGMLKTIETSAKRGADIVRQVLSFARGLEGERVEVQAKHLIGDLQNIIRDTFPKNVRLKFELAADVWTIIGDPTQLQQIFLNLCVNARDAMPNGGDLRIAVENIVLDKHYASMNLQAKPGRYVNITITDTGSGIPQTIIEKIFEPFFTTKQIGKGTGLGLSTVLAIVKSHEGVINVYSELGKGTTFNVYIPAAEVSGLKTPEQSEDHGIPRGNGEMILVVDDEASVRSITCQTLQAFGYRALSSTDGADGLSIYLQNKDDIALILTDTMMPVMDGPALVHAIARLGCSVKVIASSGLNANVEAAKMSDSGVTHFLTKPYTARTLLKTVRQVLDGP